MQNITRFAKRRTMRAALSHYNTTDKMCLYIYFKVNIYNNVKSIRAANVLLWSRQLFAPSSFWRLYLGALKAGCCGSFSHSLSRTSHARKKCAENAPTPARFLLLLYLLLAIISRYPQQARDQRAPVPLFWIAPGWKNCFTDLTKLHINALKSALPVWKCTRRFFNQTCVEF